ncbi:hypothetical protein AwDysgo_17620 [Bacteroidales bacterium]|nr:hypothetical protein AwDysgo_17620 [Bacteroidales bacterium]
MVIGYNTDDLLKSLRKIHKDIYDIKFVFNGNEKDVLENISLVSEVFLGSEISLSVRSNIILSALENEVVINFVPKYDDIGLINASLLITDDIPTFRISKMVLTPDELFVKRIFDLFFATLGIIVFSPIMLIVAILVKMDGGSIFYSQERLTLGSKVFNLRKFRTMVCDAEKLSGPVFAGENDPRITPLGRILRATRLDEFPQMFNILKGDMSIVGPRPERPFFVEQFENEIPEYRARLKVKAGLTGLAQVFGKYNTQAKEKLRYDLIYISKYSLFQDFIIVLQTVKILFLKSSTEGVKAEAN